MLATTAKHPTTQSTFVLLTFAESVRAYSVQRALDGARILYGLDGEVVGPAVECPGSEGGYCLLLPPALGSAAAAERIHAFHRWVVDLLGSAEGVVVHLYSA